VRHRQDDGIGGLRFVATNFTCSTEPQAEGALSHPVTAVKDFCHR
jgi:hypothetical protein